MSHVTWGKSQNSRKLTFENGSTSSCSSTECTKSRVRVNEPCEYAKCGLVMSHGENVMPHEKNVMLLVIGVMSHVHESCHVCIRHVTCGLVMSHECKQMRHVTYE